MDWALVCAAAMRAEAVIGFWALIYSDGLICDIRPSAAPGGYRVQASLSDRSELGNHRSALPRSEAALHSAPTLHSGHIRLATSDAGQLSKAYWG